MFDTIVFKYSFLFFHRDIFVSFSGGFTGEGSETPFLPIDGARNLEQPGLSTFVHPGRARSGCGPPLPVRLRRLCPHHCHRRSDNPRRTNSSAGGLTVQASRRRRLVVPSWKIPFRRERRRSCRSVFGRAEPLVWSVGPGREGYGRSGRHSISGYGRQGRQKRFLPGEPGDVCHRPTLRRNRGWKIVLSVPEKHPAQDVKMAGRRLCGKLSGTRNVLNSC